MVDSATIETNKTLGYKYFSQEEFRDTIDCLERALELDPNFAYLVAHDIFYTIGVSYDRLDQSSTSANYLEKSLEAFDPENGRTELWQIYFELANSLRRVFASKQVKYFDPNNWIEWINHYLKAINLLESDVNKSKNILAFHKKVKLSQYKADALLTACHYVGIFYFYTKKYQEAIHYCSQGINGGGQTQPELAVTYLLLGASHFVEGNTQKGRQAYETLLEIDPNHQWAKNVFNVYRDLGQI